MPQDFYHKEHIPKETPLLKVRSMVPQLGAAGIIPRWSTRKDAVSRSEMSINLSSFLPVN